MSRLLLIVVPLWTAFCAGQALATSKRPSVRAAAVRWVDFYARAYGVPPAFIAAIIDVELAWRPHLVSAKGAAGVMQLMPATAYQFGVANRFHAEENIRGGVAYLLT